MDERRTPLTSRRTTRKESAEQLESPGHVTTEISVIDAETLRAMCSDEGGEGVEAAVVGPGSAAVASADVDRDRGDASAVVCDEDGDEPAVVGARSMSAQASCHPHSIHEPLQQRSRVSSSSRSRAQSLPRPCAPPQRHPVDSFHCYEMLSRLPRLESAGFEAVFDWYCKVVSRVSYIDEEDRTYLDFVKLVDETVLEVAEFNLARRLHHSSFERLSEDLFAAFRPDIIMKSAVLDQYRWSQPESNVQSSLLQFYQRFHKLLQALDIPTARHGELFLQALSGSVVNQARAALRSSYSAPALGDVIHLLVGIAKMLDNLSKQPFIQSEIIDRAARAQHLAQPALPGASSRFGSNRTASRYNEQPFSAASTSPRNPQPHSQRYLPKLQPDEAQALREQGVCPRCREAHPSIPERQCPRFPVDRFGGRFASVVQSTACSATTPISPPSAATQPRGFIQRVQPQSRQQPFSTSVVREVSAARQSDGSQRLVVVSDAAMPNNPPRVSSSCRHITLVEPATVLSTAQVLRVSQPTGQQLDSASTLVQVSATSLPDAKPESVSVQAPAAMPLDAKLAELSTISPTPVEHEASRTSETNVVHQLRHDSVESKQRAYMRLPATHEGHEIEIFWRVDTGSDVSIINDTYARKLGLSCKTTDAPVTVAVANGQSEELSREALIELKLTTDGPVRPVHLYISCNTPTGDYALLGEPATRHYAFVNKEQPYFVWLGDQEPASADASAIKDIDEYEAFDGDPPIKFGDAVDTVQRREQLQQIIQRHATVFGSIDRIPAQVEPFDAEPIEGKGPVCAAPMRYRQTDADFINAEIQKWIDQGLVEWGDSSYSTNVIRVFSKKPRAVGSYGPVNAITKKCANSIPDVRERLNWAASLKIMFYTDLNQAYNQCPLTERAREMLALRTPLGIIKPNRLMLGPTNAPQYFNRIFSHVFDTNAVRNFFDDLLGGTKLGWDDFFAHCRRVSRNVRSTSLETQSKEDCVWSY